MSPHLRLPALLCRVIAVLVASTVITLSSAATVSSLSTFAIASASSNTPIICALAIPNATPLSKDYVLNCTSLVPGGRQENYPSGVAKYTGIAAGDGFLCGVSTYEIQNPSPTSVMRWWDFSSTTEHQKRVYRGAPLMGLGAGGSHVCGLIEEKITCWRWPVFVPPTGVRFSAIAVGRDFVCGLLKDSRQVRCYGNDASVVGHEPKGSGYMIIAASSCRVCVVTNSSRQLLCWGGGSTGIQEKSLETEAAALALGERNRTCMIDGNDTASCWGEPGFDLPAKLKERAFLSITASGEVFCGVLKSDYSLVCWGSSPGLSDGMHRVVFDRVLPGSCQRESNCPCGALAGSGLSCPAGTVVCDNRCDNDVELPLPAPQPNPPGQTGIPGGRSDRKRLIFVVVGSVGVAASLLTLVGLLIFTRYRRRRTRSQVHDSDRLDDDDPEAAEQPANWRPRPAALPAAVEQYSFEVLHALTDGFSERHKIGYGSFGSVYRAALPGGRQVAIKRADPPSSTSPPTPPTPRALAFAANYKENKEQAFDSEVELLSRVNHKNLVRLLGYCREGRELVLVYEYMANGTLNDHLHRIPDSPLVRSWASRFCIALDAARGIEYLHSYAVPPIIHRDIKPSNILLDDEGTAKVADFGLCCAAPECNERGCEEYSTTGKRVAATDTERYSASAVPTAGTVGYMDPEYYRLQCLTAKSDVYSFGVVLLELLTGRRAICKNEEDTEPCNVVDFAVPHIETGEVQLVLDPNLPPPRPFEIEAVQQVGDLAAYCVQREGRNRPNMAYVVAELQQAVDACSPPLQLSRSLTAHSV